MTIILAFSLLAVVESVHSAPDAGVTVFGPTVAPNFKRLEGQRKYKHITAGAVLNINLSHHFQPPYSVLCATPLHVIGERNAQVISSNQSMHNQVYKSKEY